jgi:hypothetical protein
MTGVEAMSLTGGCLCGAIRYVANGTPYHVSHCHCSMCRRASGAPFVSWFSLRSKELTWAQGAPKWYRSSKKAQRAFCADCGTALTYQRFDRPDELDITICSLDEPERLTPEDHVWASSKLAWIGSDGLPEYQSERSD